MNQLMLHEFHHGLRARFAELNGAQIVNDYGDWLAEHAAVRETAGVIDFSFRSRICLVGADRARFFARAGDERREETSHRRRLLRRHHHRQRENGERPEHFQSRG